MEKIRFALLYPAFLIALCAAQTANAEVFELKPDGNLVNITQPVWQPAMPVSVPIVPPSQSPVMLQTVSASVPKQLLSTLRPQNAPVQQIIQNAANRYGINGALLDALAWQESRYNNRARSSAGAIGVMQLMPGTARDLGVSDPSNIYQNVNGGAAYLRAQLLKFNNNVPLALAAYNAGPGAVIKFGGIPPYRETQNYVRQILNRMAQTASNPQDD
jgi:soluble lytic murein transglycosylase-like protein